MYTFYLDIKLGIYLIAWLLI